MAIEILFSFRLLRQLRSAHEAYRKVEAACRATPQSHEVTSDIRHESTTI